MCSTVLIVDDEEYVLEELAEAFSDEGFKVVTSGDAAGLLTKEDVPAFDLLVTDLKMPHIDGISFYAELRKKQLTDAPAILLSGHGAQTNRVTAEKAGFSKCFSKPVDLDELLDAAAALCDASAS